MALVTRLGVTGSLDLEVFTYLGVGSVSAGVTATHLPLCNRPAQPHSWWGQDFPEANECPLPCTSTFQVSAFITFAHEPLAKANGLVLIPGVWRNRWLLDGKSREVTLQKGIHVGMRICGVFCSLPQQTFVSECMHERGYTFSYFLYKLWDNFYGFCKYLKPVLQT